MSVRKRPTGCLGSSACRSPAIGAIREKQRFGSSLRNRSSGRAARLSDKCVIESAVSFGCATQWIAYPFLGAAEVAGPNIHLTARPLGVREGGVVSSATRWRHSYPYRHVRRLPVPLSCRTRCVVALVENGFNTRVWRRLVLFGSMAKSVTRWE